jgi:glycosyltransferase involved in cell wall biosynthesis
VKIVIVNDWISEKMGYSENVLPKALAKLGAEVHVVTSDLQPNFPNYTETYEPFIGPRVQPAGTKLLNGFTLHRLPHTSERHGVRMGGFHKTIASIQPHIVQSLTIPTWSTYQCAVSKLVLGYKLFLEEHTHASVFNLSTKGKIFFQGYRFSLGKLVSALSERCYAIGPDVAEITAHYYGYSRKKIEICSLGVDTDVFLPPTTVSQMEARQALRKKLGFHATDIVCLYTGRFHDGKNPLCLAKAVDRLHRSDDRIKGLFMGSGSASEIQAIRECAGCVIHPFVRYDDLPDFYRAADIAVWPRQESTSMLDAAATGLPIVVSDRVGVRDRVDGNGLFYKENDDEDLARQIQRLTDPQLRRQFGETGVKRMRADYSWDRIARLRLADYEASLKGVPLQ